MYSVCNFSYLVAIPAAHPVEIWFRQSEMDWRSYKWLNWSDTVYV